jgi:DNA-directed RNA polymerase subunit RPC12/RpoP
MKKDLVFTCIKCQHLLFVSDWENEKKINKILKTDCPECGEGPDELWILTRLGNYEKEYKK